MTGARAVDVAFACALVAYAAACTLYLVHLAASRPAGAPSGGAWGAAARWSLAAAALLHFGWVVAASLVTKSCPVASVHFVGSLVAVVTAAAFLALRARFRLDALGAFVAPVGLFFALGAQLSAAPARRVPGGVLALHVLVNSLGVALFLLAAGAAALYLVEDRRIKRKSAPAGLLGRLPPLDALDRAGHRLLVVGFPLLTLGVLTGTLWTPHAAGGDPAAVARAALGYATWAVFAGTLVLRAIAGWRGRRAAWGVLAGFAFTLAVLLVYWLRSAGPPGGAS